MTESLVGRKRNIQSKLKVKTGCATCRIRKVKCDESKPSCQKCTSTGRKCDGYESPFRLVLTKPSLSINHVGNIKSYGTGLLSTRTMVPQIEITTQDIELLGRYFSTKTMFDIQLGCNEEAREILRASLTDATIRQAVSSLRALRKHLEMSHSVSASVIQQPSRDHDHGLQQYCKALGGLASKISTPSPSGLRSALLCCQVFISIEQARGNYGAMVQHMIQGLGIMHDYRARPHFVAENDFMLVPAHHEQIPLLDVFIIKLFIAPCKFADPPAASPTTDVSGTTVALCPLSPHSKSGGSQKPRPIAPDLRAGLTRIAEMTLAFLDKVSHVELVADALQLLLEKTSLLESLELWFIDLDIFLMDMKHPRTEPLSLSFLRFFHQTLKIVLLRALYSHDAELRTEIHQLHLIANNIEDGVKAYRMWGFAILDN